MNALLPVLVLGCVAAVTIAADNLPDPEPPPVPVAGDGATAPPPAAPMSVVTEPGRSAVPDALAGPAPAESSSPGATFATQLADTLAAIDAGADGAVQVRRLRDLLAASPAIVATVADLARSPARSERCRLRLLQALQLQGDDACQRMLAVLAADPSLRDRALRALGGVTSPSPASLEVLWTFASHDAARAPLSAFARATASLREVDAARHEACCMRLRAELRRATGTAPVCALLRALRVADDRAAADHAVPFVSSPEVAIRAAAASVLATSCEPRHEMVLRDLLAHETDPEVRRLGARALTITANAP